MRKNEKPASTYARWMQKPGFKKAFEEGYKKLVLSELVLAVMAEDTKSVRELAGAWRVQNRHPEPPLGRADGYEVEQLPVYPSYGHRVVLEKGDRRINL